MEKTPMSNVTAIQTAQQPVPGARFKIAAELDGFPVEIEIEGKADNLKGLIDRLKAIGAQPPQAKPAAKTGVPVCPIHNKPMKPSRKPGSFFCPGRNEDGSYCTEKG
jgi:hypothetical protein